jgi:Ser/Thr protein kinase RdoA (MazF antagonist)
MKENEFFYKLTPQVIIDSVEREGYNTTGLCWKLNSLENRVYDLELEDKSHIVVKFYRPGRWTKNQILEEHEFLFDLENAEIPVCAPIKFKDSTSLKEIENIHYAVWKRTGGRCVDEFSENQIANLGRLLGRIHAVGKTKNTKERFSLTSENMGKKPLKFLLDNSIISPRYETEYINSVNQICKIYDELSQNIPTHRIHGDCHIGNLLFGDSGFFFLDFDDFYTGPAIQDFWMLLSNNNLNENNDLNILIENYSLFSNFEEKWLKLIEPLRTLRFIHYAGWIAKRYEDPAFKDAFPHFGTEEYWKEETEDLAEQIKIIEKTNYVIKNNQVEVKINNNETELSNKDFFWDWEEK